MRFVRGAMVLGLVVAAGCGGTVPREAPPEIDQREPCAQSSPLRNAYFGDLHVHTTYSFDAHAFELRVSPEQSYQFAKGDPVALPPLDAAGNGTRSVRLERPLDFAAVTDHSEFLGEVEACITPGSAAYDTQTCQNYRGDAIEGTRTFGLLLTQKPQRFPNICGADGQVCHELAGQVWRRIQAAAEAAYDRTSRCGFTSFVAYEYSAATGISTRHRNVIFRNQRVPFPISYMEQPKAQGLWRELQTNCLDAGTGCDVLAIPHNSNESNGHMFLVEYPGAATVEEERTAAEFRAAIEPLVEVYQHKGDSECSRELSGITGAPDELCAFEKTKAVAEFGDCGEQPGSFGGAVTGCVHRLDFVRNVLLAGLQEHVRLGVNPYQLGFIASTDTHNGTPGDVEENSFAGHRGTDDDTPEKQLGDGLLTRGGKIFSPGGLAAVWAEENSRAAIFEALRRREVFGTSGPRISARFFGGWGLPADLCDDAELVKRAYELGVTMGATLPARPPAGAAPSFVVAALGDPGIGSQPGTALQRIQIVKGWLAGGQAHEQVFEVAGDANNGASVDEATCTPSGSGAQSLCSVWTDPGFDPSQHAFYYARVLENPSCRWSTFICNRLPPVERPPACTDPAIPKTIQERAWTSPIWYQPRQG
ncbi:MAG: DUF3604 domain-containing protein [Deltaproteobacteria bacterium]|nr:DUF3604 domain-containing protein [Deltaproteobacteria bacterium]